MQSLNLQYPNVVMVLLENEALTDDDRSRKVDLLGGSKLLRGQARVKQRMDRRLPPKLR
jgi:hypothetical protein